MLTRISDGQTPLAAQLNQYGDLFKGGQVFDVLNGYGAVMNGVSIGLLP